MNWKWLREAGGAARGSYLRPLQPRNPEKIFWSCWVALVCALALGTTTALAASLPARVTDGLFLSSFKLGILFRQFLKCEFEADDLNQGLNLQCRA